MTAQWHITIYPDADGWVVRDGDVIIAGPFVTATEALEETEALGLVIENIDEVEEWQRPDEEWGLVDV